MSPQRMLPGMAAGVANPSDVVMTPRHIARAIVAHFKPSGRILDPARGDGAFFDEMPGADWCEVREGRDFFDWTEPVDWIVTNPPYSILMEFAQRACDLATNVVLLHPVSRVTFMTSKLRQAIRRGLREMLVVGDGRRALGFPEDYCHAAIHYQRGYLGPIAVSFLDPEKTGSQEGS